MQYIQLANIILIAFVQVTMQKELNVLVLPDKIISRAFIQQPSGDLCGSICLGCANHIYGTFPHWVSFSTLRTLQERSVRREYTMSLRVVSQDNFFLRFVTLYTLSLRGLYREYTMSLRVVSQDNFSSGL